MYIYVYIYIERERERERLVRTRAYPCTEQVEQSNRDQFFQTVTSSAQARPKHARAAIASALATPGQSSHCQLLEGTWAGPSGDFKRIHARSKLSRARGVQS